MSPADDPAGCRWDGNIIPCCRGPLQTEPALDWKSTCIYKRGFAKKISNGNKGNVSQLRRANLSGSIYISVMLVLIVGEYVPSLENFRDSRKTCISAL